MLRGINQQIIFEDQEDFQYFITILSKCRGICGYKIFVYCLMSNHIHLLMEEGEESLAKVFKRVCDRYVYWYNHKYDRTGPLFQGRFRSEPVETERYFLTVVRYIFQNPVKAGIVSEVNQYKWCNYLAYLGEKDFTDTEKVMAYFDGRSEFETFVNSASNEECMDISCAKHTFVSDEMGREMIQKISGCKNVAEFQRLERNERNSYIKKMKEAGLSVRQISRLTGVSKTVVGNVGQGTIPCPSLLL
ncbi:MAG: transposase [Lachnospiraceae bacterium]